MEILNTYTQAIGDLSGLVVAAVMLTLCLGLLAWGFFVEKKRVRGTICGAISALSATFVIAISYACFSGSLDETYHEVQITDMSKFDTSKYQIVGQRGKIFVVKEIGQ
ncbi:hypothetical protein V5G20_17910 [Brevibacillus borstelensis]|uniref:hypothetical protein n=1 Tax=Brevibacillus borstelensis TaxID=45462 RepID=UPI0030D030A9